jgi:hypothetical protein
MAATLQELLDAHAIAQTLARYPIALDSRAFGLFDEVFTPDARIDIPGVGRCDRAGYRAACEAGLARLDATQHFVSPPALRIEGDRAFARSYLVAQHVANALAPRGTLLIGAWYDDELARVGGEWRITARTGNPVWWDGNPAVLGMQGVPPAYPRGPGHAGPPWLLPSR